VSAANYCSQVLWVRNQLEDFSIRYENIPIFCVNTSAINLSKNPIQHSRSKHIEIKHHFIRDHVNKKEIELIFVDTENQLADIFTKPLVEDRFNFIKNYILLKNHKILAQNVPENVLSFPWPSRFLLKKKSEIKIHLWVLV